MPAAAAVCLPALSDGTVNAAHCPASASAPSLHLKRCCSPPITSLFSFATAESVCLLPLNPAQVPKRRGQEPTADAREKSLQRLATKGVVRLFNAIAKAQKQLREAEEASGSRAKAVKLGKASFLAQLKGSAAAAGGAADQPLVPSAPRQAVPGVAAAAAAPAAGSRKQQQRRGAAAASSSDEEDAAGWEVLQQGFVGLQGAPHSLLLFQR